MWPAGQKKNVGKRNPSPLSLQPPAMEESLPRKARLERIIINGERCREEKFGGNVGGCILYYSLLCLAEWSSHKTRWCCCWCPHNAVVVLCCWVKKEINWTTEFHPFSGRLPARPRSSTKKKKKQCEEGWKRRGWMDQLIGN